MLYFLVTNNIRDEKQLKVFITAFFITAVITCTYALMITGEFSRATAPFEGTKGEPNTLGGYLVFLFAVASGLLIYSYSKILKFSLVALIILVFITLMQTLSRGSYMAFIPMCLTLAAFTNRKKGPLILLLIAGLLILPFIAPQKVKQRVTKTFVPGRVYRPFDTEVNLDYAASARIETWRTILDKWKDQPLLGYGVSGLGLIDAQYPRVLGETGIIGLWMFIWLMFAIFKNTIRVFKTAQEDWLQGLTLGFLAGFIGLLAHGFAAGTFIIVRIMEPFWFMAAVVMMLPEIRKRSMNNTSTA